MQKLSISNFDKSIKFVLLLLFFCFFFVKNNQSQVLTNKEGIPMILFTQGPPDLLEDDVVAMKNLGV
ncbi:MAG: hypothetical protein GW789_18500, partial [Ignavibacteria bacterium]|nr:hypothetical protein [Ignavibacteria bacterium]